MAMAPTKFLRLINQLAFKSHPPFSREMPPAVWMPTEKLVFISMGMSNANMFFSTFREQSIAFPQFNPRVTMVNGATGGKDIDNLLDPNDSYWTSVDQKMAAAQLTNAQLQVIWFEQAKHISGIPPNEGINHIAIMEQKFPSGISVF
jgi:hypothetical protein